MSAIMMFLIIALYRTPYVHRTLNNSLQILNHYPTYGVYRRVYKGGVMGVITPPMICQKTILKHIVPKSSPDNSWSRMNSL